MIRSLLLGTSLIIAVPAQAQTPATIAKAQAPDNTRLDAARRVVGNLWPLGTYRRMMDGSMSKMMDAMLESMFNMKASDMAGAVDPSGKAAKEAGDRSIGQVMDAGDPHFRERFKITMDTMMAELIPLFEKFEPGIRDSLTQIYARDFSAQQLTEMDAFFATPTGKVYGQKWMMTFVDPEMMKNMAAFAPEMVKAMPDIMKKVEKATAHLPPPQKPKTEEAAADVEETSDLSSAYESKDSWSAEDLAEHDMLEESAMAANDKLSDFALAAAQRAKSKTPSKKNK